MAITSAVDILLDGIGFSSCNQGAKAPLVGDIGEEFSALLEVEVDEQGQGQGKSETSFMPQVSLQNQDHFSFSDKVLIEDIVFDFQDKIEEKPLNIQDTVIKDTQTDPEQDLPVPEAMLFYPDVISPHVLGHFLKSNMSQGEDVDPKEVPGIKVEFASSELEKVAVEAALRTPKAKKLDLEVMDAKVYVKSFQKSQDVPQEKSQGFSFSKMPMSMIEVLQGEKSVESVGEFKEQMMTNVPVMAQVLPQKIESPVLEVAVIDVASVEMIKTTKDTLEIQLFPESLGKVDVKLSFDQTSGHMKAVIIPETHEGYKAILKDETRLHDSIQSVIQKDSGACVSLEMRVSEPKETNLSFSMENRGFGGHEHKNPQGHPNGQHKHFFDSSFYAQSDVIPEVLDNNRRLDMAV